MSIVNAWMIQAIMFGKDIHLIFHISILLSRFWSIHLLELCEMDLTGSINAFLHICAGIVIPTPKLSFAILAEYFLCVGILLYLIGIQILTHVSPDKFTFAVTESFLLTLVHLQNRLALSVSLSCHRFDDIHTCRSISTFKHETTFLVYALNERLLVFNSQMKHIGFLLKFYKILFQFVNFV